MPFVPKTQPNGWSCLPTSFAMVLGVPISRVISIIGHDGSEIVYPDLDDPRCRKGFHFQECIEAAYVLGSNFGFFEATPLLVLDDTHYQELNCVPTLEMLLQRHVGVLGVTTKKGYGHAVAWDGQDVYDPTLGARFPISRYEIVLFSPLYESRVKTLPKNNFPLETEN